MQRLGPPHWRPTRRAAPTGGSTPTTRWRREITRLGARLIAHDLAALGINVDCLPVLDVPVPGAHEVIGDRAYGDDAGGGRAPGPRRRRGAAGRRRAAGHQAHARPRPRLGRQPPRAAGGRGAARRAGARDFAPFRVLSDMPMAMTAHVIYTAIDPASPATTSRIVISQGDPRRDRLRRPADERRSVDEGAGRAAFANGPRLRSPPDATWRCTATASLTR